MKRINEDGGNVVVAPFTTLFRIYLCFSFLFFSYNKYQFGTKLPIKCQSKQMTISWEFNF